MSDLAPTTRTLTARWRRLDRAWLASGVILSLVALLAPGDFTQVTGFAARAFLNTAPFIAFAVLAVAGLKATGAESLLARAFEGSESRMILLAALLGGLSPFCSCEVIPFIAALLALGAPLSAVMAFWLSSPLMDPAMFLITLGNLGMAFAVAKSVAAVGMGLLGGFGVRALAATGLFADPLRKSAPMVCGCGADPFSGRPVWAFWRVPERVATFRAEALKNALFLSKWLLLAYLFEALMVSYVPASLIAGLLGGEGAGPILLGALVGAPAYLNGYTAVPLVSGLLEQGMSQGAAMAFVLAGGVSSIPAAVAVWALVRPRVFAAYLGFAFIGAVLAALIWAGMQ